MTFTTFLKEQQAKVFAQSWPVVSSALVIGALNVFLFAYGRPWTASDGLRNWGDVLLQSLGMFLRVAAAQALSGAPVKVTSSCGSPSCFLPWARLSAGDFWYRRI